MTGCPNDDPNFTNFLTKLMHHSPSAQERKRIFYLVCIVVRLILLILLYYYRNNNNVRYIVLFLAIYAIYNLSAGIKYYQLVVEKISTYNEHFNSYFICTSYLQQDRFNLFTSFIWNKSFNRIFTIIKYYFLLN